MPVAAAEGARGAAGRRILLLPGGRSLAYAEAGAGPPVVLIHGAVMTLEDLWLPLGPRLASRHRVVAVDRPGHGLSVRRRLVDASPWRQARLIRDALDELGLERPVLVGHSFGATVALCLALAHPESVAGVVALAPLCFPEPRLEQALFGLRAVPGAGETLALLLSGALDPVLLPLLWRAIFLPQAVPADFARRFPWERASGAARMVAEGEDSMSLTPALFRAIGDYGSCRVPVKILGGSADIVVHNALHGLPAALMMPAARFDWIFGAGHMLHHFHQDRIAAEVEQLAAGG
ncbi:alpha/beta fold hydrolase [Methylobacterium aerolatum]|uniref:Pimeloyl-ACP methyl ester carboxylesterase n=1 Tax=Methylobacterium aerolatum TaxID=418708 RepID=A0ABU0HUQ3_9HYPH|nr:alpha/beta hydrolase [Methylobacterium aerolatum]MDQ0446058.1 pimeloyl-ACP methyl ester carboxylesterase [Methylobacterium aerolatum]GJD35094.1 putative carboxylesterase nap [Methylobacterium aerolatum]